MLYLLSREVFVSLFPPIGLYPTLSPAQRSSPSAECEKKRESVASVIAKECFGKIPTEHKKNFMCRLYGSLSSYNDSDRGFWVTVRWVKKAGFADKLGNDDISTLFHFLSYGNDGGYSFHDLTEKKWSDCLLSIYADYRDSHYRYARSKLAYLFNLEVFMGVECMVKISIKDMLEVLLKREKQELDVSVIKDIRCAVSLLNTFENYHSRKKRENIEGGKSLERPLKPPTHLSVAYRESGIEWSCGTTQACILWEEVNAFFESLARCEKDFKMSREPLKPLDIDDFCNHLERRLATSGQPVEKEKVSLAARSGSPSQASERDIMEWVEKVLDESLSEKDLTL